jgi:hypothetical protein
MGFLDRYFLLMRVEQENERLRTELDKMKLENQFLRTELTTADRVPRPGSVPAADPLQNRRRAHYRNWYRRQLESSIRRPRR